jgi:hypothetical protein
LARRKGYVRDLPQSMVTKWHLCRANANAINRMTEILGLSPKWKDGTYRGTQNKEWTL